MMNYTSCLWGILKSKTIYRILFEAEFAKASELLKYVDLVDLGGVNFPPSDYLALLKRPNESRTVCVNTDPTTKPNILRSATDTGLPSSSFGAVICFNILEHVKEPIDVINEARRILNDQGRIYFVTPFLLGIHGIPDDYQRFTVSWYKEYLTRCGLRDIEVTSLGLGPFVAAFNLVTPYMPKFLSVIGLFPVVCADWVLLKLRPGWVGRWPLGYYVTCRKVITNR